MLGGCLGSDEGPAPADAGARLGPTIRLTDCSDWREAGPRERSGIIAALREFAGGPTGSPPGRGRTLGDEDAHRLFNSYCEEDFSRRFKLYKLYTRASAFGNAPR